MKQASAPSRWRAPRSFPLRVRLGSRLTQSRLPLFPQQQTFLSPAVTSENLHNRRHWTRRLKLKRPPTEAAYFIVNWKTDSPKRILGACQKPPWVIIDPVNAARFMTAASTLQRRARSAALNAPYAVKPSRIGTPLGFLDIVSLPVQLRMPND